MAKATNLLKAYLNGTIPNNGGFIVSTTFDTDSVYSIYEITAYANVKDIFQSAEGLQFKTDGDRAYMLVEPPTYLQKYIEPSYREPDQTIPYRFYELEIITSKKQHRVMISKEPVKMYSYFTIKKRYKDDFAFLFYPTEDVYLAIKKFLADSLYNDCSLDKEDATNCAKAAIESIKKFTIWNG